MLPKEVEDRDTAIQFLASIVLYELGKGFFPRISFTEYVRFGTEEPTYSPEEALRRNRLRERAIAILGDEVDDVIRGLFQAMIPERKDKPPRHDPRVASGPSRKWPALSGDMRCSPPVVDSVEEIVG